MTPILLRQAITLTKLGWQARLEVLNAVGEPVEWFEMEYFVARIDAVLWLHDETNKYSKGKQDVFVSRHILSRTPTHEKV